MGTVVTVSAVLFEAIAVLVGFAAGAALTALVWRR